MENTFLSHLSVREKETEIGASLKGAYTERKFEIKSNSNKRIV